MCVIDVRSLAYARSPENNQQMCLLILNMKSLNISKSAAAIPSKLNISKSKTTNNNRLLFASYER